MLEYKKKDIQDCFQHRRLVFIGDSTTRQIFWAVAKKMDQQRAQEEMMEMLDLNQKHRDLEFSAAGVTVQFIWDPWLNSTGLERELLSFRADSTVNDSGGEESAALLLLGAPGLWYARHGEENFFKDFRESIDSIIPYMDHVASENGRLTSSAHFRTRDSSPNFLLLAPVQVPWYEALSPSREESITPEKIDQMNDYLQQVSAHSKADIVWSYSLMTWAGRGAYEESGLHVVENVAQRKADVLLNLRCNSDSALAGYPFNRTCCSNYKPPNGIQWLILLVGMLVLPILSIVRRRHFVKVARFLPPTEVFSAFAIFALVVCFCFYADRTQVFEKAHKEFRREEFIAACFAVTVVGIVSIKESKVPATRRSLNQRKHDQGLLSRDQTAEWKGWMQAFILIYHYTHGSKILWIYEIVRVLVASYLFMTGFGHTLFFLERKDFSLKRVSYVLIRLNLLSCVLPYMMRTNYLFYYFAPLASFWFIVIYFTLKIGFESNSNLNFILGKIIFSATVTTAFTMVPGILEFVSFFLKLSSGISWNLAEWRFRTFLDMYVIYAGMILAVLYHRASQLTSGLVVPRQNIDTLLQLTRDRSKIFATITVLASIVILPVFWTLIRRSSTKEDYNLWHPYISFFPIMSFVTLRNSHRVLRNYHSTAFAWLGRFSLETYVLQYHIWLAGDTSGLLRLGLWTRWVEAAILGSIFIWISWHTADAGAALTAWIVNGNSPPFDNHKGYGENENNVNSSSEILPWMQDGEGTPSKEFRFEVGSGRTAKLFGEAIARLRGDLRWRLLFIALTLWLGNVDY